MRLFFTGAKVFLGVQINPTLSLGGLISSSPVPNDAINAVFGSISEYQASNGLKEVRALVLKNETGADVNNIKIWYENNSAESISNFKMGLVTVGVDACGDVFLEKIQNAQTSPIYASLTDNRNEPNSIIIPTLLQDEYIGLWIERSINTSAVKKYNSCDNLYAKHILEEKPHIQELTVIPDNNGSLSGTYFFINSKKERFYIWYDNGSTINPNIAGREGVKISILDNDTDLIIALKTKAQLDLILNQRGLFNISINTNILTIETIDNGIVNDISVETTNFSSNTTQTGASSQSNQVEEINLFINF